MDTHRVGIWNDDRIGCCAAARLRRRDDVFAMGMRFASRHPRAAALAYLNGAMVLGLSMLTDYPGGVWRVISFKSHGVADAMQAGLAAFGPVLLGFPSDSEARFFYGQAASEVGVIAATDWDAPVVTNG